MNDYTCNNCKETFEKGRSDEAALQEKDILFPDLAKEEEALVCEACFIKIMDFNEPHQKRYAEFIDIENMDA